MTTDPEIPETPESDDWNDDWEDDPESPPVRKPTTREKFSVLFPALVAFIGMIAMLLIFAILAVWRG